MSAPSGNTKIARLHASGHKYAPITPGLSSTTENFPQNHEKIENPEETPYFIDNKFLKSSTKNFIDLHDPATNNLVTRVPQSTPDELNAAVESAKKAFPAWRNQSVLARQQIMFKFTYLIRENMDRLAASITLEQGKTFADAKGDVLRGLQVAETACGITTQMTGEVLEVAKDMETRSYREPLGIVAAICPFSKIYRTTTIISSLTTLRFPGYDPALVHSSCNRNRKLPDPQAFRARPWCSNDSC